MVVFPHSPDMPTGRLTRGLQNPRGYAMLDLSKIAHADVYALPPQSRYPPAPHDTIMTESTQKQESERDETDSLIEDSIQVTHEQQAQRIAQLEAENKDLKAKLQIFVDFCTCL